MAIFNSYHEAWLYRGWALADDWKKMLLDSDADVRDLCARLRAKDWKGERDRILGMAVLRYALIERLPFKSIHVFDFEALAHNPVEEFRRLFEVAGLEWGGAAQAKVASYLVVGKDRTGFDSTEKNSKDRAFGWLNELPYWHVSRGRQFIERITDTRCDYLSVPHQGIANAASGLRTWFRRIAWRLYVLFRAQLGAGRRRRR